MLEPDGPKVEGNSPLKTIRESLLEMSQQEFASMIGIAVSTVSRWERGSGTPVFTPGQFKLILARVSEKGMSLDDLPDDWSAQK